MAAFQKAFHQPTALVVEHKEAPTGRGRFSRRIKTAVGRFAETGSGNVKRLQAIDPPEFRLRIGNYRVRFHKDGETLTILRLLNRREAYR